MKHGILYVLLLAVIWFGAAFGIYCENFFEEDVRSDHDDVETVIVFAALILTVISTCEMHGILQRDVKKQIALKAIEMKTIDASQLKKIMDDIS